MMMRMMMIIIIITIIVFFLILKKLMYTYENAVGYWLKHYATNRKFAGSIPDGVIFLNLPNPSGRTRPWGLLSL
jgi:pilus assembly protein TadC